MGLRFRKSFRIFPGVRINLSKTGIGASVGFKGFRWTRRADGKIQKTFSVPGTGISYVDVDSPKKVKSEAKAPTRKRTAARCPECSASYRAGVDNFCPKCGQKL